MAKIPITLGHIPYRLLQIEDNHSVIVSITDIIKQHPFFSINVRIPIWHFL